MGAGWRQGECAYRLRRFCSLGRPASPYRPERLACALRTRSAMTKGLLSDKLARLHVARRCFVALAALTLGLVLALPAPARSDGGALDVPTLRVRLKDTPAIGPLAKLRLKSEITDLMHDLAAFHSGHTTETLEELHARYRDLVLRVIALLEQGDVPLAHDLTASTDHLWTTLADPGQFASLAKS
jgi:hypothetical protein